MLDTTDTKITKITATEGTDNMTTLTGYNQADKPIHQSFIHTPIMNLLQKIPAERTIGNSTMQKLLQKAMADAGGHFSKGQSTSFLERYTPDFAAFGWCPLFIGLKREQLPEKQTEPRTSRYFQFNHNFTNGKLLHTKMLTGVNSPNSATNSDLTKQTLGNENPSPKKTGSQKGNIKKPMTTKSA